MNQPRRSPPAVACTGKEALDPGRARSVAMGMRKRGRGSVNAYHCVHCGAWHVGWHSSKPAQKKPRKELDE